MHSMLITYEDVDLMVAYEYFEGEEGDLESPAFAAMVDIESIHCGGQDIMHLISEPVLLGMQNDIVERHESDGIEEHADQLIKEFKGG